MPEVNVIPTVSDVELAICKRVRDVRQAINWSQPDFAKRLGISRVKLASIEYGRAPLRYSVAAKMCEEFEVNQRWLAVGKEPQFFFVALDNEITNAIPPRMLFSEAYQKYMRVEVSSISDVGGAALEGKLKISVIPTISRANQLRKWCLMAVNIVFDRVPPKLQRQFYEAICNAAFDFERNHMDEIAAQTSKKEK